jgi:hypothetical protein
MALGLSASGEGAAMGSGTQTDEEIASLGVAGRGTGAGRRMLVAGRAGRRASELTAAGRPAAPGSLEACSAAVGTGLTIPAQSGQIGCPAAVRSGWKVTSPQAGHFHARVPMIESSSIKTPRHRRQFT